MDGGEEGNGRLETGWRQLWTKSKHKSTACACFLTCNDHHPDPSGEPALAEGLLWGQSGSVMSSLWAHVYAMRKNGRAWEGPRMRPENANSCPGSLPGDHETCCHIPSWMGRYCLLQCLSIFYFRPLPSHVTVAPVSPRFASTKTRNCSAQIL